ncbi:hypothetical protein [Pelomonas sp. KK5]|uniref:hypothetical protein n=1 Tax=Pelomonas sp. KK5 TaxID=1855730 RepID=UPI0013020781|nr:hypothetical protein [Pelomonas sp. KK5]
MNSPHRVVLRLNQQQLELLDRTAARGVAPDRAALVLHALRAYAAAHRDKAQQGAAK